MWQITERFKADAREVLLCRTYGTRNLTEDFDAGVNARSTH